MPARIILTAKTKLSELEKFIKQLPQNWDARETHSVEISQGVSSLLVKSVFSSLKPNIYLRVTSNIDVRTANEVAKGLSEPIEIYIAENTPLEAAREFVENLPKGSTFYLSGGFNADVAKSLVRELKRSSTFVLSRIIEPAQVKDLVTCVPPGCALRVFADSSQEVLIAATASLPFGVLFGIEEPVPLIRGEKLKAIIAQLPLGTSLFLTNNFSHDNARAAAQALKPGVTMMLSNSLRDSVIDIVARELSPGTILRLPNQISSDNAVTTVKKIQQGVNLLLNARHSIAITEAIVAEMKPCSRIYCPIDMPQEMTKSVAQKLPEGVILNLCVGFPFEIAIVAVKEIRKNRILCVESNYSEQELLAIINVMRPGIILIPHMEIFSAKIKSKLAEKDCKIVDEQILAKLMINGNLSIFQPKRKETESKEADLTSGNKQLRTSP